MALAVPYRDLAQVAALAALQQPIEDFANRQRGQHGDVLRGFEQPHQAQRGIQQGRVDAIQIQATPFILRGAGIAAGLGHQRGDQRGVDVQPQAQIGRFGGGLYHPPCHRHGHRHHQVVQGVVQVAFVEQQHLLASLHDDAQARLVQPVDELAGG